MIIIILFACLGAILCLYWTYAAVNRYRPLMDAPESPARSTGNKTSSHTGPGESGMDCSLRQAGIVAKSVSQFASTPRGPMIPGQTRQSISVHQSIQAARRPDQDPDRAHGFGDEKATAYSNVAYTGDEVSEHGGLDVAGRDEQKSGPVSESSTWSVNTQHGSSRWEN